MRPPDSGAQDALAALELGVQGGEGALGQMGVEVGDEAHGVGQVDALLEGGATLVVDEQERQAGRRVAGGQRGDQRL